MSNIQTLLSIADDVSFSNLFEVEIGEAKKVKENFKLRIESFNIDNSSLEFSINEATKAHQLTKAIKPKTISFKVRETNEYFFYNYLYNWYLCFFNPDKNQYIVGASPIGIPKRRKVVFKSYGNDAQTSSPTLTITCTNAMIQKLPSLSFEYATSRPISYEISLVADSFTYTFTPKVVSPTPPSGTTPANPNNVT
jgi:hypothetical protein